MDWSVVGKLLATSAPVVGNLLGSLIPIPGGALIGQALGNAIAKQFGVAPTPTAVSDAIVKSADSVTIAKVNAALEEVRSSNATAAAFIAAEESRMARQLEAVNQTMQIEILPENRHWYFTGWRPACGWVMVYSFLVYGTLLFASMLMAAFFRVLEPLRVIIEAWPAAAAYFGSLALVNGVNIWTRSKDKETTRAAVVAAAPVKKTGVK